jgi:protein-disulfide isomerase
VETCTEGQGVTLPDDETPFLGTRGAPIRLALFGDVRCGYTYNMVLELNAFINRLEDTGEHTAVEVQFRHFPIRSRPLARVTQAAYLLGNDAFWEMYWCLVGAPGTDDDRISFCTEWLDIDEEMLLDDATSNRVEQTVSRDDLIARAIGFQGAPGMLLCGFWVPSEPDRVIDNIESLLSD